MMLPWHRRLRRRAYELLARLVLLVPRVLPGVVGRWSGRTAARLSVRLRPDDVALARRNLALAFPDGDAAWHEATLAAATDRLGENLFDALTIERRRRRGFADITDDGALSELRRLSAEGRGVLILTGHFGCWELLGAWLAHVMDGLTVVTGVIRNAPVDRLLNDRRRSLGLQPVPRDGDLRPLLRALHTGGAVAVLLDQNVKSASMDVPFCGRPAPTATGFAGLALRTGAAILPLAIRRNGSGHEILHLPALRPEETTDPETLLTAANERLETFLRRNPDEWVWFHDRWPRRNDANMEDTA